MDIVIGGGVSGLSYALFAQPRATVILEKDSEIGGYCRTTVRNGFTWDYSGHFFHFRNPEIKDVVMSEMDGSQLREVAKSTSIYYKGSRIDFPFQKNIHQLPKEEFIDCLCDLFNASGEDYSNFKEMLYCKFGRGIAERFLVPYNEKLYACNLNSLDKDAMGRFFPYADKEDIVRNFRNPDNASYNGSFLYPCGGAVEYVKAIAAKLHNTKIVTDAEVVSVDMASHSVMLAGGDTMHYDNLVSTMPFPILLDKCGITYIKSDFSWNKVLVFNLGFDKGNSSVKDHWVYFPDKSLAFYRVGFYNNILGQTPLSLYVEIGFPHDADIDVDIWLKRTLNDLDRVGIIDSTFRLVDYESIIMDPAYVHISEKSQLAVETFKGQLASSDIYSIGRYGSWTYCSIEDNIIEARDVAELIKKKMQ